MKGKTNQQGLLHYFQIPYLPLKETKKTWPVRARKQEEGKG